MKDKYSDFGFEEIGPDVNHIRGNVEKEIRIRINKSGLTANGQQRWSIAVRFNPESQKKASETGFIRFGIDRNNMRIYFIPASHENGFKFSGKNDCCKTVTFTIYDVDSWCGVVGNYNLKKDVDKGLYYIDVPIIPNT